MVDDPDQKVKYDPDAIYLLPNTPVDLKPVAGLLTAEEGNLVSHVQLLARNLGIPNSLISPLQTASFKRFAGRRLFYAVSPGGRVVLKPAEEMTPVEQALFAGKRRQKTQMEIPTGKLDLSQTALISLEKLRSSDSGRICGPKAANLGQLKSLFPARVANGLVIPFGVFRKHLEQPMPGEAVSYWQYLKDTFAPDIKAGSSALHGEGWIRQRLATLA